jgi:hypothetical protein
MLTEIIIRDREWWQICDDLNKDPRDIDPDEVCDLLEAELDEPPIDPESLYAVLCRLQADYMRDPRSDHEIYADQEGMHEPIDRW